MAALKYLALLLLPFSGLVGWLYFRRLSARYQLGRETIRVHESGLNALSAALADNATAGMPVVIALILLYYGFEWRAESNEIWLLLCGLWALGLSLVWFIVWSCHLGAKMIGVLIFEETQTIVIPWDPLNNTAKEDFFRLKWFFDAMHLEELNLGEIEKITRQAGVKLFIHGAFGTRGLRFSSKQKRDECIAAIERITKKCYVHLDLEA